MKSKSFFEKVGEEKFLEMARAGADKAIKETHAAGLPVAGKVNGVLSFVYPDGRVEPMAAVKEREQHVKQTLASWAIEGFEPDAEYRAMLDRYIDGSMTLAQIREATDQKFGITPAAGTSSN